MKKYILPFVIILLALQAGCKDDNQSSLPEQGHHGPAIDVQHDMQTSPQVKNNND